VWLKFRLPDVEPPEVAYGRESFERSFPGANLNAVKAVIAGHVAARLLTAGEPPRIMFTGQSGASKSTTVELGADFAGTIATPVEIDGEREKMFRGIVRAGEMGEVVLIDEVAKSGLTDTEALTDCSGFGSAPTTTSYTWDRRRRTGCRLSAWRTRRPRPSSPPTRN
jgi:hypothetical protein